jgi:hypothetical protein
LLDHSSTLFSVSSGQCCSSWRHGSAPPLLVLATMGVVVLAVDVLLWRLVLFKELLPSVLLTMFHRAARLKGCRAAAPLLHRHHSSATPCAPFSKWSVPGDLAAGQARWLLRSWGRGRWRIRSCFVFWSRVSSVKFQGHSCIPLFLRGLFVILQRWMNADIVRCSAPVSRLKKKTTTASKCMHDAWGSRSDLRFVCRPPHHATWCTLQLHAQLPPPSILLLLPPYRWCEWIQRRSSQIPKILMDGPILLSTNVCPPGNGMPFQHRKGG